MKFQVLLDQLVVRLKLFTYLYFRIFCLDVKATELADIAERIAKIIPETSINVVAKTLLGEEYNIVNMEMLPSDKLINEIILLWYKKQLSKKGEQEPRRVFARMVSELGAKLLSCTSNGEELKSKFESMAQELDVYYCCRPQLSDSNA